MIAFVLMCVAASLGVGYLGLGAETTIERVYEVPVIRKTVEAIFLFPLVDSVTRRSEALDASGRLLAIGRILISAAVVAVVLTVFASVFYAWIIWAIVKVLLGLIVLGVAIAFVWSLSRR